VPPGSEVGPLRIEAATPSDAGALALLSAAALPDAWSERGFAAEIGAPQTRVWLARGRAQGLIGYLVAHVVCDEIQVLSLAVAAGCRRQGIGRRLVEHTLAQEPGAAIAHLEVRSNDTGAQAFYERLRFRAIGRRPGFYPGGVDAISLARKL
jgi:ribosomal-protein-alanine N-acetyltransferase